MPAIRTCVVSIAVAAACATMPWEGGTAHAQELPDHVVVDADAPPAERVPKFLFLFDDPVRWPGTVTWKYNPSGAPASFADAASTVARIQAGLAKWTAVCGVTTSYQGTTSTVPNTLTNGNPDLENVVGWGTLSGSTAGVTWSWYGTQAGMPRLVDGDIIISQTLVTANNQLDRVAVHEWGHMLGLAHSNTNGTVMSGPPYSSYNSLTALTDDEMRGCRCLYGAASGQSAGYLCTLPREVAFGSVATGTTSAPQSLALSNAGNAAITLQSVSFDSPGFGATGCAAGTVLGPGQACLLALTFSPAAITGYTATVSIPIAGESMPYRVALTGTGSAAAGPLASLAPTSASFASQAVGTTSAPKTLTLSNAGGGIVTVTGFTSGGSHPGDFNRAGTCSIGSALGAGMSCTIDLTFTPAATGARSATLAVATDAGSVPVIALSGTGAPLPPPPALGASPETLSFADQLVGTASPAKTVTVANTGGGTLTLSSVAFGGAAAAEFTRSGTCNVGTALGAAQSCTASVKLAPLTAGAKSATLDIGSNAGGASIALSGAAIAPVPVLPATVVEYYHAGYDHYFITIGAAEINALDTGIFAGWARTGYTFKAYASAQSGFGPICRFYLPPGYGDSHFYSASLAECQLVQQEHPAFVLESAAVMALAIPDPVSGACPPLTDPVYRVWNHRPDTNHRYTSSRAVRDAMVALGYVAEGSGPDIVTFCAPR